MKDATTHSEDTMGLFEDADSAPMPGGGRNFKEGKYLCRLEAFKRGKSQQGKGEYAVAEVTVIDGLHTYAGSNEVGERVSWVQLQRWQPFAGNMKMFITAVTGMTLDEQDLVDEEGKILLKAYQLSKGNPIRDTKELLNQIKEGIESQGAKLEVLGFGATGYAADILEQTVKADVNIVETVAHMMSAVHFCGDIDVICDIGGQDIKVLFMQNGEIKNRSLPHRIRKNDLRPGMHSLLRQADKKIRTGDFYPFQALSQFPPGVPKFHAGLGQ